MLFVRTISTFHGIPPNTQWSHSAPLDKSEGCGIGVIWITFLVESLPFWIFMWIRQGSMLCKASSVIWDVIQIALQMNFLTCSCIFMCSHAYANISTNFLISSYICSQQDASMLRMLFVRTSSSFHGITPNTRWSHFVPSDKSEGCGIGVIWIPHLDFYTDNMGHNGMQNYPPPVIWDR